MRKSQVWLGRATRRLRLRAGERGPVGGITPYLESAALARTVGVPLAFHFTMELSGQLLWLPYRHILEHIDGGSLPDLGPLAEPIRIADGWFTSPDASGHGIVFDRAVLAAHAVAS